jgi:hypothetical protein
MSTGAKSERGREVTSSGEARLAAILAAEAESAGKAEGKIKETGTPRRRFLGKPLSAHCFRGADVAPCFPGRGAACARNSLNLQCNFRHCGPFFAAGRSLILGRVHERR